MTTPIRAAPHNEVGPPFLLPLLLLLVLFISVVGSSCGCWGRNQVYVHYKPPVTGWFKLLPSNHRHRYIMYREYTLYTSPQQIHQFRLQYGRLRNKWVIFEKTNTRPPWKVLTKNEKKNEFFVSCPSQCLCKMLQVNGSECHTMNGQYMRNTTNTRLDTPDTRQSHCILSHLVQCLAERNNGTATDISEIEAGQECGNYTEPSSTMTYNNTNTSDHHNNNHHYHYKHQENFFNIRKVDPHELWVIESDGGVFGVSRNTGPCPDQLTPDSTSWVRTLSDRFSDNITVRCVMWDTLTPGD